MDCNTARLVLLLTAKNARELDAPTAKELADHLAVCSECNATARSQRRVDHLLGRAMRDVPVPAGLKGRILDRLAPSRPSRRQRYWRPVMGVLTAAAAVALFVGAWYFGVVKPNQQISLVDFVISQNASPPREAKAINEAFSRLGVRGECAPVDANYAYLCSAPAVAVLPGHKVKVPHLVFVKDQDKALMFILSQEQRSRLTDWEVGGGYEYNLDVRSSPDNKFTYLVLYTGPRPDWLWTGGQ